MTHPAFNACLNGLCAVLLLGGYVAIKSGRRSLHIRLMVAAVVVATAFLVSYVIYHISYGATPYAKRDWTRPVYLAILLTHIVLAAVNVPLVIVTVLRAAKGRFDAHKRIARWTFPSWMYVSVTGVVIYLMLYEWGGSVAS